MNQLDLKNQLRLDPSFINDLRSLDTEGAVSMVDEILETFFEIAPKMITEMSAAFQTNNLAEFNRKAHSLKSSSGNLGAKRMSQICFQLEHIKDLAQADQLFCALKLEYNELLIELKKELKKNKIA